MFKLDKRIGDRSLSQSSFKKEYATGFSVQKHKVICGWNNKITSVKFLFLTKTAKRKKKKKKRPRTFHGLHGHFNGRCVAMDIGS